MLELVAAYAPLAVLIVLMSKKDSMPSSRALPLCAGLAYLMALIVFDQPPDTVHATVLNGLLMALTPLSIVAGAIFLFRTMEVTGALVVIREALNAISTNPVAQLMIVGWAFAFLIEGASGFGTPAAIAAPVLVGLGFPALRVAAFCLVMNTIPVTFGAVGTPIWFGFSVLELTPNTLREIAWHAALINTLAAPAIVMAGLALVLTRRRDLLDNAGFIILSTLSCTLPYLALSRYSVEFPALIGGLIGVCLTLLLARSGVGLARIETLPPMRACSRSRSELLKATFPLWGTVALLVVTRIPQLGLKSLLQQPTPTAHLALGQLGDLAISPALVVRLDDLLRTGIDWQHSILYVPSLIPFVLVSLLTLVWYRQPAAREIGRDTLARLKVPFCALMGALVFVNLMMLDGNASPLARIGQHLAQASGDHWPALAPLLGALGSFFSGSATISNLTFAAIQSSIAEQLGLPTSTVLALQSVGAAMGNMVCINNIVAVTSILGLAGQDGAILKRTAGVLVLYASLAALMGLLL